MTIIHNQQKAPPLYEGRCHKVTEGGQHIKVKLKYKKEYVSLPSVSKLTAPLHWSGAAKFPQIITIQKILYFNALSLRNSLGVSPVIRL